MAYQIVSTRPGVLAQPQPSRAADDILDAGRTLLGFAMTMDERKAEAARQREHELGLTNIREAGDDRRLGLTFTHQAGMQDDQQEFATSERLGGETFQERLRRVMQEFEAREAKRQRTWQGGQNDEDRDVQRFGITTTASTARRGQDLNQSLGMANLSLDRDKFEFEKTKPAAGGMGLRFQPDDLFLSPGNMVSLYGQLDDTQNPDSAVSARADTINARVRRQFGPLGFPGAGAAAPGGGGAKPSVQERASQLRRENPTWGAPELTAQLRKEGYPVR
jgi:hypothetical protein